MLSQHLRSATATFAPGVSASLDIKGGAVTLDESWAPYAQATLEIPIPDLSTLAALDPRAAVRIALTLVCVYGDMFGDWNPVGYLTPTTRAFDLRLVGRKTNHKAGTLTLALASDETILQSYANVSTEPRLLSTTSAVTAVRDAMALAVPGAPLNILATLASKPTTTRRNLITNPSFETNLTGYLANSATLARSTSGATNGSYSMSMLPSSASASCFVNIGAGDAGGMRAGLVAGKTYTLSATFRLLTAAIVPAGAASLGPFMVVFWKNAAATVYSEARIFSDTNQPGSVRLSLTFTLPPDTAEAFIRMYHPGRLASGQAPVYIDSVLLEETDEYRPYFDGSLANSVEVTYAWTGAAHASASTAVVRAHVTGEATTWKPGVSAWDYLASLLTATGMRLFCDEQRVWRLVDSAYNIRNSVRISAGVNLVDAVDEIARNNDGTWFDAVVIQYTWTDFDGKTRVEYDAASMPNPQQVRLVEMDAVYPGPGAAAYILQRSYGRGRVLALRAISDYSAQPGMEATATLPLSPVQSGYLSAVTWNLDTDEMDIETRGLIDTPLTAWNQQPAGLAWDAIPAGVSWQNYTP